MKPLISAVYITKNAQSKLSDSLNSIISLVNEIIIIDSGSTDNTEQIAKQFNAKFIKQSWLGFGKQKQFGVEQATHDWVLCLDDDEIVSQNLQQSIKEALINNESKYHAYKFARSNYFMGRYLKHGEGYPDWSLRLFNKHYAHWSDDLVHEYVITNCDVEILSGDLLHHSCNSIEDYLNKQNKYTSLQAEKMAENGVKVKPIKIIISPIFRFIKFYFLKRGFLDGMAGFVHICIGCFNSMMKYAKINEKQKEQNK